MPLEGRAPASPAPPLRPLEGRAPASPIHRSTTPYLKMIQRMHTCSQVSKFFTYGLRITRWLQESTAPLDQCFNVLSVVETVFLIPFRVFWVFRGSASFPLHLRVFRIFRGSSCSPSAWDDSVAALGRLLGRPKPSKSLGFTELGTTGRVKGY